MNDMPYRATAMVEHIGELHRRARLATGESFEIGVHGPIREFYRLHPSRELPLPVDYIVASAAG
jgi:hypothetical protein